MSQPPSQMPAHDPQWFASAMMSMHTPSQAEPSAHVSIVMTSWLTLFAA